VEHLVLGIAVPFGGKQAGAACSRHAAAQQEDVGFLARLQDPELGINGSQLGDQPIRVRTGPALAGAGLIPGGPAIPFGQAVHGVEGIRSGQRRTVTLAFGEGRLVVVKAPLSAAVEGKVGHWWRSSGRRSGRAA
jgi:hypothetical protein